MADRLTALDATFLELEEADLSAHMHIGAVIAFEPGPAPGPATVGADLDARLDALPRYRRRLSAPRTGGLSWPCWEDVPRFEAAAQVSRARLPAPGGRAELLEWAGSYFGERLDRSRPLWELVVIEGLAGGRWALASKTHHCMVDGVGSVDASTMLFDTEPDGRTGRPELRDTAAPVSPVPPSPRGNGRPLPARAGAKAAELARLPLRLGRAGLGMIGGGLNVVRHPGRGVEALRRSRALAELIVRDELIAAPRSSINVPIGGHRRLATVVVPLSELKAIKDTLGGKLNDVVLAASAGGLRALLLSRGEEPPGAGLRAMVPVNVRRDGEKLDLGNRISSLFVELPVAEPDPLLRYLRQATATEILKAGDQSIGSRALIDATAHAPPVIHSFLARSMYATRLFNLTITNVPGPPLDIFAFGARAEEVWPVVPLAAEHAIGVAVLSYAGSVCFCLNADPDAVPDLDVLRDGIESSILALGELAERAAATA
ncbi:MAG TPA: wax ester/triacylglycerol synthase family O-acyltransferase [Solirubrobacterales bacterium]|nr:wax ester/triacylglycerol synthase family O-acyltransferase [Solirubrobacterales bacterium]